MAATDKLPADAITPKSLYTVTGAAATVWLFGAVLFTVLGDLLGKEVYRGIAFGLSMLIALGMMLEKKKYDMKNWLLVIPNAALIFINASGYNAVNNGSFSTPGIHSDTIRAATKLTINGQAAQQANFFPLLRDITWWPDPVMQEELVNLRISRDSLVAQNRRLVSRLAPEEPPGSVQDILQPYLDSIAFLKARVSQLVTQLNAQGQPLDNAFSAENTRLRNTIGDLKRQVTDKGRQLDQANANLRDCEARMNSLAVDNANLGATVKSLNAQLADCQKQLANAGGNEKAADLRRLLRDCQNKLDASGDQMREMEAKLNQYQRSLENCQKQLTACQQQQGDASQLEKCKAELNRYKQAAESCDKQLRATRDSLRSYQQKIKLGTLKVVTPKIDR